jgi:hypothetical protein
MAPPGVPDPITIAVIGTGGALVGTALTVASTARRARHDRRHDVLTALGEAAVELQAAAAVWTTALVDEARIVHQRCRSTFQIRAALVGDRRIDAAAHAWFDALEQHVLGSDRQSARAVEAAWRSLVDAIRTAAGER